MKKPVYIDLISTFGSPVDDLSLQDIHRFAGISVGRIQKLLHHPYLLSTIRPKSW